MSFKSQSWVFIWILSFHLFIHKIYWKWFIFFRGTEDYLNCKGRVDIINSTLGKALGGSAGDHALMLFLPGAYVV